MNNYQSSCSTKSMSPSFHNKKIYFCGEKREKVQSLYSRRGDNDHHPEGNRNDKTRMLEDRKKIQAMPKDKRLNLLVFE